MNVNKPISRRKALKVMGLGMLAACVPTLPSFGESPKENEKKTKRLIFYFSATGNSLYIARQLGGDEATLLKVIDGHSVANGECENCLACVHNCPKKAISIIPTPPEPEEANRNARYRNPNVSLADLIKANSQK